MGAAGSLVTTIAGGAIGAFVGGPMGAAVGMELGGIVGGMLFPTKTNVRMNDLRVQSSAYGQSIPWLYGMMRGTGNVIWSGEPHKHSQEHSAKGAMGGTTTYSYKLSFAVGICRGPVTGLRRIWANGKLIYDISDPSDFEALSGSSTMVNNFNFYKGDEAQVADPVMESQLGVGNVPANRGLCYIVFDELDLDQWGNVMPSLSFEVVATGGASYSVTIDEHWTGYTGVSTLVYNYVTQPSATGGLGWVAGLYTANPTEFGIQPYTLDAYGIRAAGPAVPTGLSYMYSRYQNYDGDGGLLLLDGRYFAPGSSTASFTAPIAYSLLQNTTVNAFRKNNRLYTSCFYSNTYPLQAYDIDSGALYTSTYVGAVSIIAVSDSYVWAVDISTSAANPNALLQFDLELNYIGVACLPANMPTTSGLNNIAMGFAQGDDEIYVSPGTGVIWLFEGGVMTDTGIAFPNSDYTANQQGFAKYGDLFISTSIYSQFAVLAPTYDTTGISCKAIIDDICGSSDKAGLAAGQWDASQCTDLIKGYAVTSNSSARDALNQLMGAYFIDVADTDGLLKFVRRGASPVVSIPYSDLGAGGDDTNPLPRTIRQEQELPKQVAVSYYGANNDYNTVTQTAFRTQTASNFKSSAQFAMTLSDGQALSLAQTMLWSEWVNSEGVSFSTSTAYMAYEPTDVVSVTDRAGHTYTVRLTTCSYDGSGVLQWAGVLEEPTLYPAAGAYPAVAGAVASGYAKQSIGYAGNSVLTVLDVPPLSAADTTPGLYLACCGYGDSWPGCEVDLSRDDATFNRAAQVLTASTMGYAGNALGNFFGGNIADELNSVTVFLYGSSMTLASVSYASFLNNANMAYIGGEIVSFRTATLNANGSYTLTGLLRGLLGTEAYMGTHAAQEAFVLLSTALASLPVNVTDVGTTMYFNTVTYSAASPNNSVEQSQVIVNERIRPLSPVLFNAFEVGSGSTASALFNWLRRARFNAQWNDSTDVPLDETAEGYTVTASVGGSPVWTYSFSQTFSAASPPTCSWPSATASIAGFNTAVNSMTGVGFGTIATGAVITVTVQQHSDQGILGAPATTTFTKA